MNKAQKIMTPEIALLSPTIVDLSNFAHCNVIIGTREKVFRGLLYLMVYVKHRCPLFADKSCTFLSLRHPFPPG